MAGACRFFSEDSLARLRAYARGYWSDGGGFVEDIYGPRGRLELSFDDPLGLRGARFTLGGEVQHDELRGTQAFATARLRIPLQAPDKPLPKLTAQEARMTARGARRRQRHWGGNNGGRAGDARDRRRWLES